MTLTAVYRTECGAVTALITDIDVTTACGITCDGTWWCECGMLVDRDGGYIGPVAVCRHLRTYGMAKRTPS